MVQQGIAANPDNWKLYYQLGFINYTELKNYALPPTPSNAAAGLPTPIRS